MHPLELLSWLALLTALMIAGVAWRHRRLLGALELTALAAGLALWNASLLLMVHVPTLGAKLFWQAMAYVGIASIPLVWFVFAARVTLDPAWLRLRLLWPLGLVPTLSAAFGLLGGQQGLLFGEVKPNPVWPGALFALGGPWWPVHTLYSYALILGGLGLLTHAWRQQRGVYRSQIGVWIAAIAVPFSVNVVQQLRDAQEPWVDLTPGVLTLTGLIMLYGLLRHRLLILSPIALETVLDSIEDGVIILDEAWRVVRVNPAAAPHLIGPERLSLGREAPQVLVQWSLIQPHLAGGVQTDTVRFHLERGGQEYAYQVGPILSARRRVIGALIMVRDVTESQRQARHIHDLVFRDALTGLGNRRALFEEAQARLEAADQRGEGCALLYIDLDRFKTVNDHLGHEVGDALLIQVAERLRAQVKARDLVCRNGGDEFVVLLEDLAEVQAGEVAARLEFSLGQPYRIGSHDLHIGASVGMALFPQEAREVQTLLSLADHRMYQAKTDSVRP